MLRRTRIKVKEALAGAGLLSAELILISLMFLASLIVFSWLVKFVFIDGSGHFDERAFTWTGSFTGPGMNSLMQGITFLGTHTFLIPANLLLIIYFLFIRKHRWYSIKVAAIAISSTLVMLGLKLLFSRPRPLIPLLEPAWGYSFPSGHSMMSFAFYGLLIFLAYKYLQRPWLKWSLILLFGLLILLIGLSRIYLRVHYATDVLAGFAVGIFWLILSIYLLNHIERFSKRRLAPVVEEAPPEPEVT
jgi:membrane-associated phospholipid phosphatase